MTLHGDKNHSAKVRRFGNTHNRPFVSFCIPCVWYFAKKSRFTDESFRKKPYLCTTETEKEQQDETSYQHP